MKLSVIVPCFNAAGTISTLLKSLAKQDWSESWEVIISDNGSTDGTLKIVERYKQKIPNLRVVDSSDRQGPGHARNVGALAATGNLLAFCDADDEVAPGWVAAIGEALSRCDFVASRFEHHKLNGSRVSKSWGGTQQNGLQPYAYPPYLPHAGGSGLGVKRALHEAIGGFDETLPRLQDTDYCWRIQLAGTKFYFVSDAVVHVRHRDTLAGMYRQSCLRGEYNVLMYEKYRQLGMPKLACKDVVRSVIYWMYVLWKRFLKIRHKGDLAPIISMLGNRVGRIRGCIKQRAFAP